LTRAEYIELRGLSTLVGSGGIITAAAIAAVFALLQGTATQYVSGVLNIPSSQQEPQGGR
jgi:hypothetical protein